jgi:AbrB family looped-hinge helix DNA binding protein
MSSVKVTSKGRLTIPKEIRDALHIQKGDRLIFRIVGERKVEIEREKTATFDRQLLKSTDFFAP